MSAPESATPATARPRIMVVEDEALIALDLERRLQRAGFDVVGIADNRDEALELFARTAPDAVMMDIHIHPPVDGIETARALAERSDVPVVFLTAFADTETLKRAAAVSPYGYLLKPFDERTLVATLTVALERHANDTQLRLLGAALDSATVGIALMDVRGDRRRIIYGNPQLAALAGRSADELCGRRTCFIDDDDHSPDAERLRQAVESRTAAEGVVRMPRNDDRDVWVAVTLSPMTGRGGDVTHMLAFQRDITQLRETESALAEKVRLEGELRQRSAELESSITALRNTQRELVQREKLASLGELVAGLTHEVNTPLGVSVTAASLAREAVREVTRLAETNQLRRSVLLQQLASADEALATLEGNLHRSSELMGRFKTVAVDRTGGADRPFELGAYLTEVVASLRPMLRTARVQVDVRRDAVVPVVSSPGLVAQLVTNFVSNALMHAFDPGQQGTIILSIQQDGADALLSVEDDGCGMPAEVAARAFDPFFTTRRGTGGSGLGLFVVHSVVTEGLGGQITLTTAPGKGTRFDIRFPRRRPTSATA